MVSVAPIAMNQNVCNFVVFIITKKVSCHIVALSRIFSQMCRKRMGKAWVERKACWSLRFLFALWKEKSFISISVALEYSMKWAWYPDSKVNSVQLYYIKWKNHVHGQSIIIFVNSPHRDLSLIEKNTHYIWGKHWHSFLMLFNQLKTYLVFILKKKEEYPIQS